MKLKEFTVRNYKKIGSNGVTVYINDIVVLIGENNAGKSTLLDAYEVLASSGAALKLTDFHNEDTSKPVEIIATFCEVSEDDMNTIGQKWITENKECTVMWKWEKVNEKGDKYSQDPITKEFSNGGMGGWDNLLASRIPKPIRIKPSDSLMKTEAEILDLLKDYIKENLEKSRNERINEIEQQINSLTHELFENSKEQFDSIKTDINERFGRIFPNMEIELELKTKNPLDEKLIGSESFLKIKNKTFEDECTEKAVQLISQGSGLQRALLWSVLSVMSKFEKKRGKVKREENNDCSRILLIDEPEAFLHPPVIRNARESLYNFAINHPNWQVLTTTHSPIFIDLSKDHTTIVRVDSHSDSDNMEHYISTNEMCFTADEKENLKMIRACNPMVNEFFFYKNVLLVEGVTEKIIATHFAEKLDINLHIIDCLGKANIPMFAKILNKFKIPYMVIHDSDSPKIKKKDKIQKNPAWKHNKKIRQEVELNGGSSIYVQIPNFEQQFTHTTLTNGKVSNALDIIYHENLPEDDTDDVSYKEFCRISYEEAQKAYENFLKGKIQTSQDDFLKRFNQFVENINSTLTDDEKLYWQLDE